MNFAFSDEQDEFRQVLRRFFEEKASAADVRRAMATPAGYDTALWKQMATELGLPGIHVPEAFGGQGFGFLELGIALEEMGRVVLPGPFLASAVLATGAILNAGSDEEKRALLPALASGEEIASLAWLDGRDWDASALALEARPEGGALLLSGVKQLVLSGDAAHRFVVAARLPGTRGDDGITLCTLAAGAAGVRTEAVEPLDGTRRHARLELDGARAKPLGAPGSAAPALRKTLRQAAIALSAEMLGGAERALEMAVAYAKLRVQFARPIGSFQAVKHKVAEVLLDLELARSAGYWSWWVAEQDAAELAEAAHLAKAACGEAYRKAAAENVQVHGGIGFTWEHDAQLYWKRAESSSLLLGDSAYHRAALATALGF